MRIKTLLLEDQRTERHDHEKEPPKLIEWRNGPELERLRREDSDGVCQPKRAHQQNTVRDLLELKGEFLFSAEHLSDGGGASLAGNKLQHHE